MLTLIFLCLLELSVLSSFCRWLACSSREELVLLTCLRVSLCVSVCVSLQMKSTEVDQGLFTDSYCKVCSAQLISESQRVAHYEVETPTHITSHSPPPPPLYPHPRTSPKHFMLNERPFALCPRRRHADLSHLSPAADAPSIHT